MYYRFFINTVKNLILNPSIVWQTVDSEGTTLRLIRNGLLFPSIILVSISAFAGSLIFSNVELSLLYSVLTGIKFLIVACFTVYSAAWILKEITYPLDLGRDFNTAFIIVVFSCVPFLICQFISRFFESFLFINILGLYGLYIFWTGAVKLLNAPKYKNIPMLIAMTISITVIYAVSNILLTRIFDKVYYSFFA